MELERRYRQLISVPDPNLTFTDMINIKSNLAIIGVIYLAESTSNLSDYEPGDAKCLLNYLNWTRQKIVDIYSSILKK